MIFDEEARCENAEKNCVPAGRPVLCLPFISGREEDEFFYLLHFQSIMLLLLPGRCALFVRHSAFPDRRSAFPHRQTAFPRRRSAFSHRQIAFSYRRSAFSHRQIAFPRRRSAFLHGQHAFSYRRGALFAWPNAFPQGQNSFPPGRNRLRKVTIRCKKPRFDQKPAPAMESPSYKSLSFCSIEFWDGKMVKPARKRTKRWPHPQPAGWSAGFGL